MITDGWQGYGSATSCYHHTRLIVTGRDPAALTPRVQWVAPPLEGWLLGTDQGGISAARPRDYLDQFTDRFNPRTSTARGLVFFRLLEQALDHPPSVTAISSSAPDIGNCRASHPTGASLPPNHSRRTASQSAVAGDQALTRTTAPKRRPLQGRFGQTWSGQRRPGQTMS